MHTLPTRIGFAVAFALTLGCQEKAAPPSVQTNRGTVTVEVDNGETAEMFRVDNVAAGTTLESVMRSIAEVPITIDGSGLTAFVDRIGDKATSGSEGWTFTVDGEFAHQGIGSTTLTPPTTITWSYGDASEIVGE